MKTQNITSSIIGKIALLSLLFFFVGMTTTFAQSERGKEMRNENANRKKDATPEEKAEKKSQKWKTEFGLNDIQTAQVRTALVTRISATDAIKNQGKSPEKREKRKAIMTEFDTKIKGILSPTQYAAYQAKKDEKKEKVKENKGKNKDKGKNKGKDKSKKNDDNDDDDNNDDDNDDF
jgi:Spy/CpxP family protein refolding chaperone